MPKSPAVRWERSAAILPPPSTAGRLAHDHRRLLAGMHWVMCTGATWREIPEQFGPWHTVSTRDRDWCNAGIRRDILAVLTPNPPVDLSYLSLEYENPELDVHNTDRNDALVNVALIAIGVLGILDTVVAHWTLGLHRAVPGPQALSVEVVLVVGSAALLALGLWREVRARR